MAVTWNYSIRISHGRKLKTYKQSVQLIASPSCKFHDYPVMRSQIRSVKTCMNGATINQALVIKAGENVNIRDANTEYNVVSDGT